MAKKTKEAGELKLDLGCGPNKREGFVGVDVQQFDGKVDVVTDLRKPWPWKDGTVDEVHCSHFLEHLTQAERCHFANELYRVLKEGRQAMVIVPAWSSERAYGDPTHVWPPVVAFSFLYWNKAWRAGNAPHINGALTCDFDFGGGYPPCGEWKVKSDQVRAFAERHYLNAVEDMWVTLTKVKRDASVPNK